MYTIKEKAARTSRVSSSELEADFGPIWLSRRHEMTRKMILAEKAYGEANRAAKVAANDAITQDVAIVPELIVDPPTTPQQFGKILSAPERKHIDDWLDENHTQAVPSPRALHRKQRRCRTFFPESSRA